MPTRTQTRHVVVDGSNLATEGRSLPSLKQLNEAVLAYMEEHPDDVVTVVVDATCRSAGRSDARRHDFTCGDSGIRYRHGHRGVAHG